MQAALPVATQLHRSLQVLHTSVARALGTHRQLCCAVAAAANAASRTRAIASSSSSAAGSPQPEPLEPALYVVGTPIGNLEDISFRAIRILKGVNLILAEDTRHTRKLLDHFDIRTPTLSCHEHNEQQRQQLVVQRLQQGEPIALVSDAGMPAISDPGSVIVMAAVAAGVRVVPVPGPCAAIAALAAAGLSTEQFYFVGFLPPKSGKRRTALQQLLPLPATLVFYVPPHGLAAILADMADVLGPQRQTVVARELTKLHEEFFRGSLQQVLDEFGPEGRRTVKGEVVVLVSGCSEEEQQLFNLTSAAAAAAGGVGTSQQQPGSLLLDSSEDSSMSRDTLVQQLVAKQLAQGKSVSATAKALSQQLQISRSKLYKIALELSTTTTSDRGGAAVADK